MVLRPYIVSAAIVAPLTLSLLALSIAMFHAWWFLAAIPFIWLSSLCAQPNLNLADGCLAWLCILLAIALLPFLPALAVPILAGAISSHFLSALEKRIRMRPNPNS